MTETNIPDGTYRSFVWGKNGESSITIVTDKKTGYWVSSTDYGPYNNDEDVLKMLGTLLHQTKVRYVGIWTGEDGRYVDVSYHIEEYAPAYTLGKAYNQKAIYDIANNKEIKITN